MEPGLSSIPKDSERLSRSTEFYSVVRWQSNRGRLSDMSDWSDLSDSEIRLPIPLTTARAPGILCLGKQPIGVTGVNVELTTVER